MEFLAAWRFLTAIPVPGLRENTEKEISGSLVFFPVVGAIIGLIMAGLAWLLDLILPQMVISILVVIATAIITGAMHLDGLADTCDGLGGHTVAERQEIMRDSRHGTFGVAAIAGLIVFKTAALASISQQWLLPALIATPLIGRWTMVYCVTIYRYARPSGLGTIFKGNSRLSFLIGTILAAAVSIVLFLWAGLIVVIIALGTAAAAAYCFKKLFGGLTGDNYGAVNEIAEAAVLLVLVILTSRQWLLV